MTCCLFTQTGTQQALDLNVCFVLSPWWTVYFANHTVMKRHEGWKRINPGAITSVKYSNLGHGTASFCVGVLLLTVIDTCSIIVLCMYVYIHELTAPKEKFIQVSIFFLLLFYHKCSLRCHRVSLLFIFGADF